MIIVFIVSTLFFSIIFHPTVMRFAATLLVLLWITAHIAMSIEYVKSILYMIPFQTVGFIIAGVLLVGIIYNMYTKKSYSVN